MILLVRELFVKRDHVAIRSTYRRTKYRHAQNLFFPRDLLAIHSLSHAQRQKLPGGHIRSQVGVVVAREADKMGYNAEDRVRIDEEGIGLPADLSDTNSRVIQWSLTFSCVSCETWSW